MPYYILHGLGAHARENWFPWLKDKLEKRGEKVIIPNLPNTHGPTLKEWLSAFKKEVAKHGEGIIIGHSLGGVLAIRYLEGGGKPHKIILVATPFEGLGYVSEIDGFFTPEIKLTDQQKSRTQFTMFYSDNDPYMPSDHIKKWNKLLEADSIIIEGREHFNDLDFPEILDYL